MLLIIKSLCKSSVNCLFLPQPFETIFSSLERAISWLLVKAGTTRWFQLICAPKLTKKVLLCTIVISDFRNGWHGLRDGQHSHAHWCISRRRNEAKPFWTEGNQLLDLTVVILSCRQDRYGASLRETALCESLRTPLQRAVRLRNDPKKPDKGEKTHADPKRHVHVKEAAPLQIVFGTFWDPADVIKCAKSCAYRLRGFWSYFNETRRSHKGKLYDLYLTTALPCDVM